MSDETLTLRCLRVLSDHPEGLTAADFIDMLPASSSRTLALTRAGGILRRLEKRGEVTRSKDGTSYRLGSKYYKAHPVDKRYVSDGLKKDLPSHVWRITDQGRSVIQAADEAPECERRARLARAELEEAARRAEYALGSAVAQYGRHTPIAERRAAAVELRTLGCSYQQIGDIFGVSREQIRQDIAVVHGSPIPRSLRACPNCGHRF